MGKEITMEDFENSVSTEEVAEPQTEVTEAQETSVVEEVAKPQQSAEENARFAENRRKQELDQARKELAELKKHNELLTKGMNQYFDGTNPEELYAKATAYAQGKSADEVLAEIRQKAEREQQEQAVNAELEYYRSERARNAMEADLKAIQALDPLVKSLDDLGEDYAKLIQAGIPATKAYFAIKETMPKPTVPSMGAINTNSNIEKDFFTREEVESMSDAQIAKNLTKIQQSRKKWAM